MREDTNNPAEEVADRQAKLENLRREAGPATTNRCAAVPPLVPHPFRTAACGLHVTVAGIAVRRRATGCHLVALDISSRSTLWGPRLVEAAVVGTEITWCGAMPHGTLGDATNTRTRRHTCRPYTYASRCLAN
jgi:hypothetical protein